MIPQKDTLKKAGLRVTPARIEVLKIFENSKKPLDTLSIYSKISDKNNTVDQATIYRIVENFMQKDLIVKVQLKEKKFYYEAKRNDHHHAICENCGSIEDILNCGIKRSEKKIEENTKFKIKSHNLEFYGLCQTCQV